jgi:SSS family solute:Na+ symporter
VLQTIIIVIYLGVIAFLGYLGFTKTKNTKDYYLGGRKIHPAVMAFSYGATFISTSAIISFGGTAGVFGFSLLWLTFLNIFLGIFIAFIFFGKRTRRIGHNIQAHTFPEFLGKRYNSKFIQRFAGIVIFLFMPIYAAAVMIGAAKFIESGLNVDYNIALLVFAVIVATYVFFGGIKSVMYSDAFQGSLMLIGMSVLLVTVYWKLGGVTAAHQQLTDLFKNSEVLSQTEGLQANGFQGWTSMPKLFSSNWWTVVSSIVMGVGIGVLAQPQLTVRFMTVKSDRDLNRAIPIGGVFILLMTGVAFLVGALSNVFFFNEQSQIAVTAAGGADSIIPEFLKTFIPEWFMTIFLVVLLSAGMSTISSQFHAIGTAVGRDVIGVDDKQPKKAMLITRLGMLVAIAVTIMMSYILPEIWSDSIAISTGLFFGLCCAAFLPMYFGALYFKSMTKTAAISGMVAGFSSSLLWMMFIHTKESKAMKIAGLLFGKDSLAEGSILEVVDPIIIALTASVLVTIIVQLFSKKTLPKEHIDECFDGIK